MKPYIEHCDHFDLDMSPREHRSYTARRNYYLRNPERRPRLIFTPPGWSAVATISTTVAVDAPKLEPVEPLTDGVPDTLSPDEE